MKSNLQFAKICPWSLAISLAIIWSISTLILCFMRHKNKPTLALEAIHQIYFGVNYNKAGGIIILTVSAFLDALIGGLILGYLYNFFSNHS